MIRKAFAASSLILLAAGAVSAVNTPSGDHALSVFCRVDRVVLEATTGQPALVEGDLGPLPPGEPAAAAVLYLERVGSAFDLGPDDTFAVARVGHDALGQLRVRLLQRHQGLEVDGGEVILLVDQTGTVRVVNGHLGGAIEAAPVAALDVEGALRQLMLRLEVDDLEELDKPELVYVSRPGAPPFLAWRAPLRWTDAGGLHREEVLLDADDGVILERQSLAGGAGGPSADPVVTAAGADTVTASGPNAPLPALTNGQTVTGLAGAAGSWSYYRFTVPFGQSFLEVMTWGGAGDCDLYLKRAAQPTATSWDYRPDLVGNNETVTVTNPTSGDWYIGLHGDSSYSGLDLRATYGVPPSGMLTESESNNSASLADVISDTPTMVIGFVGTGTDVDYFKLTLPGGSTLAVDMTVPGDRDYDLKLYNGSGVVVAASANGTGQTEHVVFTNTATSGRVIYVKVYPHTGGGYSTTSSYSMNVRW